MCVCGGVWICLGSGWWDLASTSILEALETSKKRGPRLGILGVIKWLFPAGFLQKRKSSVSEYLRKWAGAFLEAPSGYLVATDKEEGVPETKALNGDAWLARGVISEGY